MLSRLDWDALKTTAGELGLLALVPETNPTEDVMEQDGEEAKEVEIDEEVLKKLHTLLMETGVTEGKLVCGNCEFEYPIKEGVGNFLLPPHLV